MVTTIYDNPLQYSVLEYVLIYLWFPLNLRPTKWFPAEGNHVHITVGCYGEHKVPDRDEHWEACRKSKMAATVILMVSIVLVGLQLTLTDTVLTLLAEDRSEWS